MQVKLLYFVRSMTPAKGPGFNYKGRPSTKMTLKRS